MSKYKTPIQNLDNLIRSEVMPVLHSKTFKQTSMLYISQLIVIPLGIIMSSIVTRSLGPDNYGVFTFYNTLTGFSVIFFRFGFDMSGSLLTAQENDKDKIHTLIGALVIFFLIIGASYSLFIFGFSFFVDNIFNTNVGYILRWASIALIVAPFHFMILGVTKGSNQIGKLAIYQVVPKALTVLGILALISFYKLNLVSLISLVLMASIIVNSSLISSLKPSLKEWRQNSRKLWLKNREYGFNIYLGHITSQPTYNLDGILISYFVNTTQLGFYSLASTITSPMSMLSQSLAISLFKGFVSEKRIPKNIIYLNLLWLASCVIGVILIGKYVVILLFSKKFSIVSSLAIPWSLANLFRGMYQPYSMFLGAHGMGKEIRNIALIQSVVNVLGNLVLIYIYGIWGAVIVSIISTATSYLTHIWYYRKYLLRLE